MIQDDNERNSFYVPGEKKPLFLMGDSYNGLVYRLDHEKIEDSRGEVSSPVAFNRNGDPVPGGLRDPNIFGKKSESRCRCGLVTVAGATCPNCLEEAKPEQTKTSMGHIKLPIKYYGANKPLIAAIIGVFEDQLEKCWYGEKEIEVKNPQTKAVVTKLKNAKDIETYIDSLDQEALDKVIERMKRRCSRLEGFLAKGEVSKDDSTLEKDERLLESNETVLRSLKHARAAGLLPKDLMSGVLLCLPIDFRPVTEFGIDPEGPVNRAYSRIISACESIKSIPDNVSENIRSEAINKYAAILDESYKELDIINTKKGLGQKFLSTKVDNSYEAVAEANANYHINEVGIPYNVLLKMYRKEMMEILKKPYENALLRTKDALNNQVLSEEDETRLTEAVEFLENRLTNIESEYDNEIRIFPHESNLNSEIYKKLEAYLEKRWSLADRFPNVTGQNYWTPQPRISMVPNVIFVNPAIANTVTFLDFDGDKISVMKARSESSEKVLKAHMSSLSVTNSMITGVPIYGPDREFAMGLYLATMMYGPEDSIFKYDSVITEVDRNGDDGHGFLRAKRIIAKLDPSEYKKYKPDSGKVYYRNTVVKTKNGPVKIDEECQCVEINNERFLIRLCDDRVEIPPHAKTLVKAGDVVAKNDLVLKWDVPVFPDVFEALKAYSKGDISANNKIRINDPESGLDVASCGGRLRISEVLSKIETDEQFILYNEDLGKKGMTKKYILDQIKSSWDYLQHYSDMDYETIGKRYLNVMEELQKAGQQFMHMYGELNGLHVLAYPDDRDKNQDKIVDLYNYNSAREMKDSGAKGSETNFRNQVMNIIGLRMIEDVLKRVERASENNKGGLPDPNNPGMSPVQLAGRANRLLQEAMAPYSITMEDCGTDIFLDFSFKGLKHNEAIERGLIALEGRTLGEDYQVGDQVVPKNIVITKDNALAIAEDAYVTGRSIKVRNLNGCKCTGGCALCFGAVRTSGRLVEVGTAVGIMADHALTSTMSEKMVLKLTTHEGNENASAVTVVNDILNGTENARKIAAKYGPERTVKYIEKLLADVYRNQSKIDMNQQYFEVIARGLVNIHVINKKTRDDAYVSYGMWLRDYKNNPDYISITRIRPMDLAARGPLGNEITRLAFETGGGSNERGGGYYTSTIVANSIEARAKQVKAKSKEMDNG